MDPNLAALLICSALTVVGVVVTVLIWPRAQWKTIVWWIGVTLLPIAVYLLGLVPRTVQAWQSLVDWAQNLQYSTGESVGLGLAGLGILLALISRIIPARPRRPREPKPGPAPAAPAAPGRPAVAPPASGQPAPGPASQPTPSDEFDEITAILKRRGIE